MTIQIRTLTKVIKAGNLNDETYNKLRALVEPYLPSSPPAKIPQQTSTGPLSAGEGAEHVSTPAQDDKYGSDAMHKATDLRQVMNEALQMDSDSEMVRVLQARLVQSPETMKMFQLAFQAEIRTAATQSDSGNPSEEHSTYHDVAYETSVSHDAMTGGVEVESLGRSASNPSTANEQAQPMQIAKQYRMLLQHGFHPSKLFAAFRVCLRRHRNCTKRVISCSDTAALDAVSDPSRRSRLLYRQRGRVVRHTPQLI